MSSDAPFFKLDNLDNLDTPSPEVGHNAIGRRKCGHNA